MKRPHLFSKLAPKPVILGLSEDEAHYCLVKNLAGNLEVFWQSKQLSLEHLLQQATQLPLSLQNKSTLTLNPSFLFIRPVTHSYIWRKTIFMANSLSQIQLHQKVVQILKNEQPLPIESLNFDYQIFPIAHHNLNKIVIYAIRKSYANYLSPISCILDCELHCYMRALLYLQNTQEIAEFPCFAFQHKIVQFTENGLQFLESMPESCIDLSKVALDTPGITIENQHLYFLALGASLWNGKALI